MTERRGRENKLKIERLRQRAKTAKVPESASPICLGAPPSPGLRDPGNSQAQAEAEGEGQGWEKPWAGEAAGSQGRAEAGGPDARVLQTAPYPAQDCALAPGPLPSSNWSLGTPTAVPTVRARASPVRSQPPIPAGASATPHRHAPSLFRLGAAPLPQPRAPRFPSPPGELRAPGLGVRRVWTVTRGP